MCATRIPHGVVNAVYWLPEAVLKVARPAQPRLHRSLERELTACATVGSACPGLAPTVLNHGTDWAVFSRLEGEAPPLQAYERLLRRDRRRLALSLGESLARLHIIRAPAGLDLPYRGSTWPERLLGGFDEFRAGSSGSGRDCAPRYGKSKAGWSATLRRSTSVRAHWSTATSAAPMSSSNWRTVRCRGGELGMGMRGDPGFDLARLVWLPMAGRSARMWTDAPERRWFLEGYHSLRPDTAWQETAEWYSLWLAAAYLTLRLMLGAAPSSCSLLERFLLEWSARPGTGRRTGELSDRVPGKL